MSIAHLIQRILSMHCDIIVLLKYTYNCDKAVLEVGQIGVVVTIHVVEYLQP